jgi:hypothetical protein
VKSRADDQERIRYAGRENFAFEHQAEQAATEAMKAPLDTAGILWVAALDRVPARERVAWVSEMESRVAEVNAMRADVKP